MNFDVQWLFLGLAVGFALGHTWRTLWDFFMERR